MYILKTDTLTVLGSALCCRCYPATRSLCSPSALSSAVSRCRASSVASRPFLDEERFQWQDSLRSQTACFVFVLLWLVVGCRRLGALVCVRNSALFPQLPKRGKIDQRNIRRECVTSGWFCLKDTQIKCVCGCDPHGDEVINKIIYSINAVVCLKARWILMN